MSNPITEKEQAAEDEAACGFCSNCEKPIEILRNGAGLAQPRDCDECEAKGQAE